MQDIVDAIDDAVGALRSSAGEGAGQAREQAPTLRHLAETARMMSEESGTLAERFTGLLTRFATAQDDVERTRETVRELATAVRELADTAQESRAALERFAGLMERIGEIVALVRQVSDRTNLLALNAAIEAARAGEHGKGFDVVASEVRRLAERTRASTQQMRSVLGDLGARGGSASQAISAGVVQAERSARQAAAAEEALARIDEFTGGVIETLAEAQREATTESQRAFAMRGDFDEMAALTEYHSEQSLRSVESTQALERERRALFAEGAPAAPANGALQPHLSPGENR
jgi:methyl-accepting chemotaxis protein